MCAWEDDPSEILWFCSKLSFTGLPELNTYNGLGGRSNPPLILVGAKEGAITHKASSVINDKSYAIKEDRSRFLCSPTNADEP